MSRKEIRQLAKKIWDYHLMNHKLEKADCILVLGSNDTRVAERGAQLFLEGWSSLLIFSGGTGRLTESWNEPEADKFAKVAIGMGVPKDKILIENKSSNTGENIEFTEKLLTKHSINPKKVILVQKPWMERRSYATFKKVWPDKKVIVTSPQIPFEEYPNEKISEDEVINIMVGDLQRIKVYPKKGFQITQEIPEDVWTAYDQLVALGYTKQLVKE
ncbi:YdcF family protein [Patescibacteria group bacterium]|nr:MAG: YdcF family protein [Patescibacteria group bacterium]